MWLAVGIVVVAVAFISAVAELLSIPAIAVCTALTVVLPVNTSFATQYFAVDPFIPTDIVYVKIVPPLKAVVGTILTSCIYPLTGRVYIDILLVKAAVEKSVNVLVILTHCGVVDIPD